MTRLQVYRDVNFAFLHGVNVASNQLRGDEDHVLQRNLLTLAKFAADYLGLNADAVHARLEEAMEAFEELPVDEQPDFGDHLQEIVIDMADPAVISKPYEP